MNFKLLPAAVLTCLVFSNFSVKNPFPPVQARTVGGPSFSNESFKGKKTIVLMFHLGCQEAMLLCRDLCELQSAIDTSKVQIIGIAENTAEQVTAFNSEEKNTWSSFRKYFGMAPLNFPIVAECETEAAPGATDTETRVANQCRKLGEALKIKAHPTVFLVNGSGEIYGKITEYMNYEDPERRQAQLLGKL
jgi:hypothetical protein